MCERKQDRLPLTRPQLGTWRTTQGIKPVIFRYSCCAQPTEPHLLRILAHAKLFPRTCFLHAFPPLETLPLPPIPGKIEQLDLQLGRVGQDDLKCLI